jgi:hypothetical protein
MDPVTAWEELELEAGAAAAAPSPDWPEPPPAPSPDWTSPAWAWPPVAWPSVACPPSVPPSFPAAPLSEPSPDPPWLPATPSPSLGTSWATRPSLGANVSPATATALMGSNPHTSATVHSIANGFLVCLSSFPSFLEPAMVGPLPLLNHTGHATHHACPDAPFPSSRAFICLRNPPVEIVHGSSHKHVGSAATEQAVFPRKDYSVNRTHQSQMQTRSINQDMGVKFRLGPF